MENEIWIAYLGGSLIGVAVSALIFKWICIDPLIRQMKATRKLLAMYTTKTNVLSNDDIEGIENEFKN